MPASENERGPWSETPAGPETRDDPKIEPWVLFGASLIIAVTAVLFATGTWIVRSHQSSTAVEREATTAEELQLTKQDLDLITTQADELGQQVTDLQMSEAAEQQELRTVRAELESIKRERDEYSSTLEETRRKDTNPTSLQTASLSEALGSLDAIVAYVSLDDEDHKAGLARGALLQNLKQIGRTKCGIGFTDSGDVRLTLIVIAVTSERDVTALGVTMRLAKAWKVPGQDKKHHVFLWQSQTVGLCSRERAPSFVEELVDLLMKELASELQK